MQLGRGGRCLACKVGIRTTNLQSQQALIGIIFTNADPKYAGRFDDRQGVDTIVTVEKVTRKANTSNAELADESTWLWLTSEQMGFPLRLTLAGGGEHEKRAQNLDNSQRVRDHLVAYHLALAITDFISNENLECCNNDLKRKLTLVHSEWIKELSPRGNVQHIIHSLSATQLTRKVQSSCVKEFGGKRPRCQQLHMTLAFFVSKKHH